MPVVFTDWLSMIAALGVGFLPSASRTADAQSPIFPFPRSVRCPFPKVFGTTILPGRKIVAEHTPGASAPKRVQDAVDHLPKVYCPRASSRFGRWDQGSENIPLFVGEIAGIGFAHNARSIGQFEGVGTPSTRIS